MRHLQNALLATIVIALTVVGMYAVVETASSSLSADKSATVVALAGQTYLCPRTGCSTPSCHAVSGTSAAVAAGTAGSSASGTVCPRTGCSASTCHGATGAPPPSGGGSGRHRRGDYGGNGTVGRYGAYGGGVSPLN